MHMLAVAMAAVGAALANCEACNEASQTAHQSSKRQSPWATIGLQWQLLHLGADAEGSAGAEAVGSAMTLNDAVPPLIDEGSAMDQNNDGPCACKFLNIAL